MTPDLNQLKCDDTSLQAVIDELVAAHKGNLQVVSDTICAVGKRLRSEVTNYGVDSRDYADKQDLVIKGIIADLAKKVDELPVVPTVDTVKLLKDAHDDAAQQVADALKTLTDEFTADQHQAILDAVAQLKDSTALQQLVALQGKQAEQAAQIKALEEAQAASLKIEDVACVVVGALQSAAASVAASVAGFKAGTMQCIWGVDPNASGVTGGAAGN